MADSTTTSPPRSLLRRRELRAPTAAAIVVVALVAVLAVADPTGLLAPLGGHGMPVLRFGSVYQWAPLVVGLPVLLVATALPVYVVGRRGARARWVFLTTWVSVVGSVALAAAATGFAAAL